MILKRTSADRYRPLTSFSQKLRFLIDIQISIFDRFHERLHSGLEAYLSMTSSIGRTVQGITKEEQAKLQGLEGLERLCRIYGSADYLEKAMRDWSDDLVSPRFRSTPILSLPLAALIKFNSSSLSSGKSSKIAHASIAANPSQGQ